MRLARDGRLVMVRSYHFDDMTGGENSTKELPVRLSSGHDDWRDGWCNMRESDFRSSSGMAYQNPDGTISLIIHSNCHYDFKMNDGGTIATIGKGPAKAKRPENVRMQAFLAANGIEAKPKYFFDGSLKHTWRLSNPDQKWSLELAQKLNALGFTNWDGKPLDALDGNGGDFCVFVRGHNELLQEPEAPPQAETPHPGGDTPHASGVYWRNIPQDAIVTDLGASWTYNGRCVDWQGIEAQEAQSWLRAHSKLLETPSPVGVTRTKHTQKGYDLFVVALPARVPRSRFMELLGEAKALGGWWSSYDKDGAIPGFQFKAEIKAAAFLHVLDGKPSLEQIQAVDTQSAPATIAPLAPVKSQAEKLRTMAESLTAKIEDKRRPMTANPTPKRNREYRSRLHDSDNMERVQRALIALADAHEAGTVPPELVGIKTKAQIEPLVYKGLDGGGYYEVIPSLNYRDTSPAGKVLQRMIDTPQKQDKAREISLLEQKISLSTIPSFFPTPPELVQRMIDYCKPVAGERILEPSAGSGAIAAALNHGTIIEALETNYTLRELLTLKGINLVGNDFADFQPAQPYDCVIMNPPFEKGQDIAHIRKAWDCLRPGGRLAAIASASITFRDTADHAAFREWLDEIGADVQDIPAGAFKRSGTGVASKMILATK